MKTRVLVLALTLFGSILPTTAVVAQSVVLQQQFTLQAFPKPSFLAPGEVPCSYFLWTKAYTQDQRISFIYVDKSGKTTGDTPVLRNITTILIDKNDGVPIATTSDTDEKRQSIWQISMSQKTYDANQKCLGGIPVKAAY